MLIHLYVKDFAIVESLDLELEPGMTTITGETGAGKSISIDALGLCLGDRAEAGMVRAKAAKAEVAATFNIKDIKHAQQWLNENELNNEESPSECIIRRTISQEGRSRASINGVPVPLTQLKAIANYLVNIHGQHAHQLLLKNDYQLDLLDQYAAHQGLLDNTLNAYQYWAMLQNELKKLQQQEQQQADRLQLIEYQVSELDEFALQEDEFEQIEEEHKRLSNTSSLTSESQKCLGMLYENDEHSAYGLLQSITHNLASLNQYDDKLEPIVELLNNANIQLEEASNDLRHYLDSLEVDPSRLVDVEARLSTALDLARKHKVKPEQLYQEHQKLSEELKAIHGCSERSEQLEQDLQQAELQYKNNAEKLSLSRQKSAKHLSKHITKSMQKLNMEKGVFDIKLSNNPRPTKLGCDDIDFLVCANPGQPLQALGKVASGGELSRISLAIQVITAERVATPTLIFDEVDVGISGATASIVGQMLRQIGKNAQIICVTHLPQVAACGHQQMQVSKSTTGTQTKTHMKRLDDENRVIALANLLGGDSVTDITVANAKELLAS